MRLRVCWAVVSMVGIGGVSQVARAQEFELYDEYALQANGTAWVAGDFDADGDPDIAVVTAAGDIAVALNDGAGAFTMSSAAVTPLPAGFEQPVRIATGDFDGDGFADLIVAGTVTDSASSNCSFALLKGVGDGTFAPGATETTIHDPPVSYLNLSGLRCQAINAADYDGDGALDVALESAASHRQGVFCDFNVFFGRADGTFADPTLTDVDAVIDDLGSVMVSADFDGDGRSELAFGVDETYTSGQAELSHYVEIFSSDDTGRFSRTFVLSLQNGAERFVDGHAQDVTGDGQLDLLLFQSVRSSSGSAVQAEPLWVLPNDGDGTLSLRTPLEYEYAGVSFESADFNGDRRPDLLLVSEQDRVTLELGDGLGGYMSTQRLSTGGQALTSLSADFDGDGVHDFAVLDATRPVFRVALAEPDGSGFRVPNVTALEFPQAFVAPGDYDGDGKLDVLTSEYGVFEILFGAGDGSFTRRTSIATNATPTELFVADLNGDGLTDLVLPEPGRTFRTLFASPDGTFSGANNVDVGNPGEFPRGALGDFDGDGDLDLAVFSLQTSGYPPTIQADIVVYANDGAGSFAPGQDFPLSMLPSRLLVGDLNGDGQLDLFVGASPGTIWPNGSPLGPNDSFVLIGDGTGEFVQGTALPVAENDFELGDLNGDGKLDLLTNTSVVLGNGDGTFGAVQRTMPPGETVALGDLDGDGKLDVVSYGVSSLELALGNGDGTFPGATTLLHISPSEDEVLRVLGLADFTGDGIPDLYSLRLSVANLGAEIVTFVQRTPEPPPPHRCPRHRRPRPRHHFVPGWPQVPSVFERWFGSGKPPRGVFGEPRSAAQEALHTVFE